MENYHDILSHLLSHYENEVVEFKAAQNSYDVDDLGKYFSALSNEANLRERDFAWIVFVMLEKMGLREMMLSKRWKMLCLEQKTTKPNYYIWAGFLQK